MASKFNRYSKAAIPALILLGATVVLQWHAIKFWVGIVGEGIGQVWSITLEVLALWLWAQTKQSPGRALGLGLIAIIATLMSLMGALMQKGLPIVNEIQEHLGRIDKWELTIESKRQEVDSHHANWMQSVQNSATRSGWLGNIEESQARYVAAQKELEGIIHNKPDLLALLDENLQLLMLLFALIVFQVASVLLARRIGECFADDLEAQAHEEYPETLNFELERESVLRGSPLRPHAVNVRISPESSYPQLNAPCEERRDEPGERVPKRGRVLNMAELVDRYFAREDKEKN